MRHLALSIVIVSVLGCGAGRPAATPATLSGDLASGTCAISLACNEGGGTGSLLVPAAVVVAGAVGIAAIAYVYQLVTPPPRITFPAPP